MSTKSILSRQSLVMLALLSMGMVSVSGCSTPTSTPPPTETAVDHTSLEQGGANRSNQIVTENNDVVEKAIEGIEEVEEVTKDSNGNDSDILLADEDSIEPANLETITLADLPEAQGERYSMVRDRLLERGWMPHTFATTNGPPSDFNDPRVQEMEGLGFMEVKVCSGTGQGFCRFEFVHQDRTAEDGPILAVTTAAASPSDPNYPEPIFWEFRLDDVSNLNYADRSFDQALFTELRETNGFCLGVGRCDQEQYILDDGLLIAGSGDFGSTKMSFIPHIPVSKEEAIAYARILDVDGMIDFSEAQFDSELKSESYYEADFPVGGGAELGGATVVQLKLTPNGIVSEISFSTIVF